MFDRLSAHGIGRSNDMTLISTVRDTVCAELFEDPGYPWSIQRQTAVLSPWDAPPPEMNRGEFLDLMHAGWDADATALWGRGVTGVMRPALGGDGVGILWRSNSACQSFINAMAGEGQRASVEWMPLAESAFASWLEARRR